MKKRRVVQSFDEADAKRSCISRPKEPTLSSINSLDSNQTQNAVPNNLESSFMKPVTIAQVQQPDQNANMFGLISNISTIFAETIQ